MPKTILLTVTDFFFYNINFFASCPETFLPFNIPLTCTCFPIKLLLTLTHTHTSMYSIQEYMYVCVNQLIGSARSRFCRLLSLAPQRQTRASGINSIIICLSVGRICAKEVVLKQGSGTVGLKNVLNFFMYFFALALLKALYLHTSCTSFCRPLFAHLSLQIFFFLFSGKRLFC